MRITAAIAILLLLAALLSGCNKAGGNLLDKSKKPGNVLPDDAASNAPQDLTKGTPPAGGAAAPPPAASSGGSSSGGAKSGGKDNGGGDDEEGGG